MTSHSQSARTENAGGKAKTPPEGTPASLVKAPTKSLASNLRADAHGCPEHHDVNAGGCPSCVSHIARLRRRAEKAERLCRLRRGSNLRLRQRLKETWEQLEDTRQREQMLNNHVKMSVKVHIAEFVGEQRRKRRVEAARRSKRGGA